MLLGLSYSRHAGHVRRIDDNSAAALNEETGSVIVSVGTSSKIFSGAFRPRLALCSDEHCHIVWQSYLLSHNPNISIDKFVAVGNLGFFQSFV